MITRAKGRRASQSERTEQKTNTVCSSPCNNSTFHITPSRHQSAAARSYRRYCDLQDVFRIVRHRRTLPDKSRDQLAWYPARPLIVSLLLLHTQRQTDTDRLPISLSDCFHAQSNVQEYLGGPDEEVEPTLKKFQETMSKYKFMELNTAQRRRGLEDKIPDIRKTLQMVTFLKDKKDDPESIETTFELNDTLYAKAKLDPIDTVHLWLGVSAEPSLVPLHHSVLADTESVKPLFPRPTGQRDARIPARRSHLVAHRQAIRRRKVTRDLEGRSRLSPRADHRNGSQHGARTQLGCQAPSRTQRTARTRRSHRGCLESVTGVVSFIQSPCTTISI